MGEPQDVHKSDPRHHTLKLKAMLEEACQHARDDIEKIDDPKGQALFETTAEVLGGLLNAFTDYELRTSAWQ
jgi:hypothetical protein